MRDLNPTVADLNCGEDDAYDDRERTVGIIEELELLNYTAARDAGDSQRAINAYFGAVRASELELQYRLVLDERERALQHAEAA